eukprot:5582333-Amphidinium_carterae.1
MIRRWMLLCYELLKLQSLPQATTGSLKPRSYISGGIMAKGSIFLARLPVPASKHQEDRAGAVATLLREHAC